MTLASSGTMSIGGSTATRSINLELGLSATATSNMNSAALRGLADVASGAISLSNFYGKSDTTGITVTQGIGGFGSYRGYSKQGQGNLTSFGFGSRSPTTWAGGEVLDIYWKNNSEFYICLYSTYANEIADAAVSSVVIPGISGTLDPAEDSTQTGANFKRWGWYDYTRPSVWDGSGDLYVQITDAR